MRARGWEVEGVEPDPQAAAVARGSQRLRVQAVSIEKADLPREGYDVVTMSHVIEHVADPVEALQVCRRALRPGGRLILVTPNVEALGRRVFGKHWMGWDVPRHLTVFSTSSLAGIVERAGLRVTGMRTSARSVLYSLPDIRLLGPSGGFERNTPWKRGQALVMWLIELATLNANPCGEEIVMEAGTSCG
jgi:2-polyprenyl-3-methyl-5-hydroxy-6-metoxy-1,4-benzoquinol methylase